ncbi:alpha tubulin suppressor [Dispira parvispora]|uniref:Alpha tubulin suppressor n=1 Tax=Dispira parvispora TaxID=1520584 RepID=A0A9W8E1C8_9FUNG|nr:alpha tubulin suppressor [Dispira parvispora]
MPPTTLFSLGSNSSGQLGVGHLEDSAHPVPSLSAPYLVHALDSLPASIQLRAQRPWLKLTGGGNHAMALTDSGQLLACGSHHEGQLGLGTLRNTSKECPENLVTRWTPLDNYSWTDVACGWNHTLAICNKGHVYAFGCGTFGQLGLSATTSDQSSQSHTDRITPSHPGSATSRPVTRVDTPQMVPVGSPGNRIVKVACGLRHSVALDQQGQVWGWGVHRHGQLGCPDISKVSKLDTSRLSRPRQSVTYHVTPQLLTHATNRDGEPILLPKNIVQIACGQHHTVLLTDKGTVVVLGSDKYGQHGWASRHITNPSTPQATKDTDASLVAFSAPQPIRITKIASGWNHVVVLCSEGSVFSWGRNDHGQLGDRPSPATSDSEPTILPQDSTVQRSYPYCRATPERVLFPPDAAPIIDISCGSEHTLALDSRGVCYAWGWNEHGNCGLDTLEDVRYPRPIPFSAEPPVPPSEIRVAQVGCGYGFSLLAIE